MAWRRRRQAMAKWRWGRSEWRGPGPEPEPDLGGRPVTGDAQSISENAIWGGVIILIILGLSEACPKGPLGNPRDP